MLENIPFGYKYDKKKKQLIVDKKEEKVVKKIFSLSNYGFDNDEVAKLLNGIPVYKVISDKIFYIIVKAQEYNEEIGKEFVSEETLNINLEDILKKRDNIDEKIIKVLNENKKAIEEIDSTVSEVLLDDIDKVINILNHLEEITDICREKTEKTRSVR